MRLIVNGQEKEINTNTIQDLIDELGIGEKIIAAAVNMNVIKKDIWSEFKLNENDKIEFLEFVGGG